MRIAFCSQNNATYTIEEFPQTEGFEAKRRSLLCTECRGEAFYRGQTRNGREACFGARHAEGCTLATVDHDGVRTGQGETEDEILTTGQRIVVDFNFGAQEPGEAPNGQEIPVAAGPVVANAAQGPGLRDRMHRRLSSILRSLIETEEFRTSNQIIEVNGNDYTVADFFMNFADATEDDLETLRGFWGMIPNAQVDQNGTLWFNSGSMGDISAFLDRRYVGDVQERFRWEEEEELAGAHLLVFGFLRRSRNGKRCIEIIDPGRFTLRLAR